MYKIVNDIDHIIIRGFKTRRDAKLWLKYRYPKMVIKEFGLKVKKEEKDNGKYC